MGIRSIDLWKKNMDFPIAETGKIHFQVKIVFGFYRMNIYSFSCTSAVVVGTLNQIRIYENQSTEKTSKGLSFLICACQVVIVVVVVPYYVGGGDFFREENKTETIFLLKVRG